MAKYFTILTSIGAAQHANAQIQQTTVPWTHMALGDGGGAPVNPSQAQAGLVREVHRLPITAIEPHPTNANWIVVEAVVPNSVGGWTVREAAIFGGQGGALCIAVGNYPDTYKPVLAEGAVREMVMRMIVEVSSTATVNLVIDPAVAIASRGWVEGLIATTEKRGIVELATDAESSDGVDKARAVTPSGLRAALPRTAFRVANGASLNELMITGLYYADGALHGPDHPNKFFGWLRNSAVSEGVFTYQEAFDVNGGYWRRSQNGSVWATWIPVQNKVQLDSIFAQILESIDTLKTGKESNIQNGGANTYWAGDKTWKPAADIAVRSATTAQKGVVELATHAEVNEGVSQDLVMTPAAFRAVLPATAFRLADNSSVNDASLTGLYYASGALNGPAHPAKYYGWIRHSAVSDGVYAYQEAFDVNGGYWRRSQENSVWAAWIPVQNKVQLDSIFAQILESIDTLKTGKENQIPNGGANTYWAGDKTWKPAADMPVRSATTAQKGVVELATHAEVNEGVSQDLVMTPAAFRAVLPATAFRLADNSSVNDASLTGLYYASGALNGPAHPAKYYGWIRHSAVSDGVYAYQEAFDVNGGYWRRSQENSVWAAWIPVQNKVQLDSIFAQILESIDTLKTGKENQIPNGGANTYWAGDKTWKPAADMPVRSATIAAAGVAQLGTINDVYTGNATKALTPDVLKTLSADSGMVVFWQTGVSQWDVPDSLKAGAKKPYVIVVGAGGGCFSFSELSRGGGGGGATEGFVDLTGVSKVQITVGSGVIGANGASSAFGTHMSATGGSAGQSGAGAFSRGGTGVGGGFNRDGAAGGGPDGTFSGEGGASPFAVGVSRSNSGLPGMWPGGGAGAGSIQQAGGNGVVIVKW